MERETRFELATLALARRCSTTELLPLRAALQSMSSDLQTFVRGGFLPEEKTPLNAHSSGVHRLENRCVARLSIPGGLNQVKLRASPIYVQT